MGATASSAQRDSRCNEDAAAEQRTAEATDAREERDADDTGNGQISRMNLKTTNHVDEVTGHVEERVLADVCSGFVPVKEDGTETIIDLQDVISLQPNTKNEDREIINEDDVTVKEETMEIKEVNNINEVGFKKVFRFVGFKFTLKKDTCEKTEEEPLTNDQEEKVAGTSEDTEKSSSFEDKTQVDEPLKSETSVQPEDVEPSEKTENETQLDQNTGEVEENVEVTSDKEKANVIEEGLESEEPMSPFKQFFTQGIFSSLRRKRNEDEIQKETKEEELAGIEQIVKEKSEKAEKVESKCMCLDIPYMLYEEKKDLQPKENKLSPEEEIQHSLEKDKVQGSPLKRLFRKFSSRRQRESKGVENVIEDGEKVTEQPESSLKLTDIQKAKELVIEESKPAVDEQAADVGPEESKKKSDSSVSWEALICGSSGKKRPKKTTAEGETQEKGEDYEKKNESPLGSSIEGDFDHLTSSNEQDGEEDAGSTWKTFKKLVTPKRKVRTGESSSSENIPSDGEINKDDSFSIKKLISGRKKRKSDVRQEQTSSDETGMDAETGDEDDETPAIVPLSEYEIIEPESVKEVNEEQVEVSIEHKTPEIDSQREDKPSEPEPKPADKVSNNDRPLIIRVISEEFEEFTDFISKHQQLSDIPEEGIIEESVETPSSSAEWTTQDDTLAEDIVDLTADAVTAPEPASEELIRDNSTEMVSAVSQLTDSPGTSGHLTPVSAEYGVEMSNIVLQEVVQSISMTPSVQSVTTKDKRQEASLVVSYSPYIIQSTISGETKVFVAHVKTEATAICTGLISQELESVEENLSTPFVEAMQEISYAVPTELVSDNLTDTLEVAGFEIDEVYEAKTECLEVMATKEEEQEINQELAETLTEVSEESHVVHNKECLTDTNTGDTELRSVEMAVIDTMQSEAVLDQVIQENYQTHDKDVTAEDDKDSTEVKDKVHTEEVELIHADVHEIHEDVTDLTSNTTETEGDSDLEVISAGDLAVIVEDISEKMEETGEENIKPQEIKDMHAEQSIDDVEDQNIKSEHISETAAETLDGVQIEEKQLDVNNEVSLSDNVLFEQTAKVDKVTTELCVSTKEIDTDVDNIRVGKSEEMDNISTTEKEKLAVPKSDEIENQEVSEIIEDDEDIAHAVRVTCVSEISMDVLKHKEITTEPEASSELLLTHLETSSVMPQDDAKGMETGDEWSQDVWSQDVKQDLEIIDITENTTKQSEREKPVKIEPVAQSLKSKEEDASTKTESSAVAISCDQMDQAKIGTEIKETAIPELKDTIHDVTQLEQESPAVNKSAKITQNDAGIQMINNSVTEQKDESTEDTKQLLEKPMATKLQEEKVDIKDEVTAVIYLKEEPEVASIVQVPPLTPEMKAETPEVAVSETQTQEATELKTATLEITARNVETPAVAEVTVETVVVPDLGLEMPVVTSVVTELEVETLCINHFRRRCNHHSSAQNTDINSSLLSSEKQEVPTVTPPDLITPVLAPGSKSMVISSVEDKSNVILEVESPVDPKMQNATPMVETPAVSSVTVTKAIPTNKITESGTSAASPLLETPVVCVPSENLTEPSMTKTSTETPVSVLSNVTVDLVIPVVLVAEPKLAQTSVVSPEVNIPVISITFAEPTEAAMAPVDETSALVSETVSEDVDLESVTPAVVERTLFVNPEVTPIANTSPVTQEVETQDLYSVIVTDAASPIITETSAVSREVETLVVKTNAMVQTPTLVSVIVKEGTYPIIPTVTAVVEVSVVESPSNLSAVEDTPVMIPERTPLPVSVETSDVIPSVQTPVVVLVTPAVETPDTALIDVTLDVISEVNETKSEPSAESISDEENAKVTSTEPQSEVNDDIWEDAVDNIADGHCQMRQTDVSTQDDAVTEPMLQCEH